MHNKQIEIDKKLIESYKSGNANAMPKLVERWHKQFCNKALWIVKDADVAKDVAQESWRIIIQKIHNLKDSSSFGGWASRIVYTKALDWVKQSKREREKLQQYQYEHITDDGGSKNELLQKSLLKSIKQLPLHQQQVISLFYVEEYSLKEISEIADISIGTAKSRLFHAREKLKQLLKNKQDDY